MSAPKFTPVLPGILAALQSLQAANLRALREGEGRGLTTRQMAEHLERESGYRDLYAALEDMLKHGGSSDEEWIPEKQYQQAKAALAKARGEK